MNFVIKKSKRTSKKRLLAVKLERRESPGGKNYWTIYSKYSREEKRQIGKSC